MSENIIRWGILGTGRAAIDFAQGLRHVSGSVLAAVGSRTAGKAEHFARSMGARQACDSFGELVSNHDVDVVYVATPNALHREHCLLALNAGKAVLCEKPFAMNSVEAQEVIAFARLKKLFCMEAMWMHFLPGMQKAMDLVRAGAIGEPRMLTADFGVPAGPDSALFSPVLGGGALMDRGVYPLALAWQFFGKPEQVEAISAATRTGVDEHSAILLRYPAGQIAMLAATITGYPANTAVIAGTEGRITIHEPLCRPDRLTLTRAPAPAPAGPAIAATTLKDRLRANRWIRELHRLLPGRDKLLRLPYMGNGYNYEAAEVVRCLRAGIAESPVWPLDNTAGVMQVMDIIRRRQPA